MKTEQIAKICHAANRAYCQCLEDHSVYSMAHWDELSEPEQKGYINGVEFRLANPGCSAEDMHRNWLVEKTEAGWVYGQDKNLKKKTHPCILPYDRLPEDQKVKDFLFMAILSALTDMPEVYKMGTVDPVFNKDDKTETVAFVRGFVKKYIDTQISKKMIFEYLNGLIS